MSENRFLKLVNKTLTDRSTEIEISGETFLVHAPMLSTLQSIQTEARIAAEQVGETIRDTSKLKDVPEEIKVWATTAGIEIRTKRDAEMASAFGNAFTRAMVAECVRYADGSKLWNTPEERTEVVDAIFEMPDTLREILRIVNESSQKKMSNGSLSKRQKDSLQKSSSAKE